MVERGLFRGEVAPAVLTLEAVPSEDVRAAKWGGFSADLDEFEEADDRRSFDY
jgi:hypothetical protein